MCASVFAYMCVCVCVFMCDLLHSPYLPAGPGGIGSVQSNVVCRWHLYDFPQIE